MPTISESGNPGNSISCGKLIMDEFLPIVEYKSVKKEKESDVELQFSDKKTSLSEFLDKTKRVFYPYIIQTEKRKLNITFQVNIGCSDSYDEDGSIKIKSSINDSNIKISPTEKHVDYNDQITIDIEYSKAEKKEFYLDFLANDDSTDYNVGELKNVHCGRIYITFLETAIIKSVEFIDKDDNTTVSGQVEQYVNLPADIKFVDGSIIKNLNRLSQKIKIKVKLDRPGKHKFKIELVPGPGNIKYSDSEKKRNPNFKYQEKVLEYTSEENGEKIIDAKDIFISPAGSDVFELSGTDLLGNTVKSSGKVITARLMHYVEVKMKGITSIATSLTTFKSEFNKHNIRFEGMTSVSMAHMENIGENDGERFKKNVQVAYKASKGTSKAPYCIAIAYTDHLAVKESNMSIPVFNVKVGGKTSINIIIQNNKKEKFALWRNIITGEDWFVECYFVKKGGNPVSDKFVIQKNKCIPSQPTGYCTSVNIDVSALPKETGTILLKVNWVNRMRAGLSFPGINIVAICTKAWWTKISTNDQNGTIIHEIGHQLGMTSDGSGKLPDKISSFYDTSKGHIGNHCHYGIAAGQAKYDSNADSKLAKCVMYGSSNGYRSFCINCTKALKKVDLINGV